VPLHDFLGRNSELKGTFLGPEWRAEKRQILFQSFFGPEAASQINIGWFSQDEDSSRVNPAEDDIGDLRQFRCYSLSLQETVQSCARNAKQLLKIQSKSQL
jgi:hypothetical protein